MKCNKSFYGFGSYSIGKKYISREIFFSFFNESSSRINSTQFRHPDFLGENGKRIKRECMLLWKVFFRNHIRQWNGGEE